MPSPPVDSSIYFERLDSFTINVIHPRCFICGIDFTPKDICLSIKGEGGIARLDEDCFEQLVEGLNNMYTHKLEMKVFSLDIN